MKTAILFSSIGVLLGIVAGGLGFGIGYTMKPENSMNCNWIRGVSPHPADSRVFIDMGELQVCVGDIYFPGTHTKPLHEQEYQ